MYSKPFFAMKHFFLPALFAVLALVACSGEGHEAASAVSEATAPIARTVQEVAIASGTPVSTADISIDGMSCEMACGSAIRKALAALPGVSGTQIEFHEGDVTDHAVVTYDEKVISDKEMVDAIQKLYDGQYKVLAVSVTKQVLQAEQDAPPAEEEAQGEKISASLPAVLVPTVFELLSQIVRF